MQDFKDSTLGSTVALSNGVSTDDMAPVLSEKVVGVIMDLEEGDESPEQHSENAGE